MLRPYKLRTKKSSRIAEDAKALVLGSPTEIFIKCHELQTRWVILGSNNSRTYLQGIRSSERVRLDNPFSMSANNLNGGDF
jgi:hypothetical protein